MRNTWLAGWMVTLCGALPAPALADLKVEAFSPQGSVKDVRQVAVRFSAPVVRFGDPRLPDPFDVDCARPGRSRWADARNWVYDFAEDLPAGVRCRFTVKADLKSVAGDKPAGQREFVFDTGGPAIRASMPREGDEQIDEQQIFLVRLDTAATEESVRSRAFCAVSGIAEKIPVQIVTGEDRGKILQQRDLLNYEYFRVFWKSGRESLAQARGEKMKADEALLVALRCTRALPPATQVQLVWGQGIASPNGIATPQDQTLSFRTRPAFAASFSCERANAHSACLPMTPMTLTFTAPIARELAAKIVMGGRGGPYKPKLDDDTNVVERLVFKGPFPERAKLAIELPSALVDDAGRPLANAARFPLEVETSEAPPLVKFGSEFGILEHKEGGVLPVTLRNVEPEVAAQKATLPLADIPGKARKIDDDAQILTWMARVADAMRWQGDWEDEENRKWKENTGAKSVFGADDVTESFSVPKPQGAEAFEVVGIPLTEPGFYVVELKSPKLGASLLGDARTRYVATSALVTNMAVHFKQGRESSLVFVTYLDTGKPVAEAAVRVNDGCSGAEHWQGRTDAQGIARIAKALPESGSSCEWTPHPLMVSARAGDDMSFTMSTWNRGISPYDFNLPVNPWSGRVPVIAHTVLDRALFRAGETVSMKHFLRAHTERGLAMPGEKLNKLVLSHEGSGQTYELPLKFDGKGIAESRWSIPKDAKLGTYGIDLRSSSQSLQSGSFRVEQYRVPSMRAILQPPKDPLVDAKEATIDLFVSYLSGGAAGYLPVKLRTQIVPKTLSFAAYPGFRFGGRETKEGIESGAGHGAFYEEGESEDDGPTPGGPAQTLPLVLDGQGAARATVPKLPKVDAPHEIAVELEYQDANGETLTAASRVALWPSNVVLGIQPEGWVATSDDLRFKVLALDLSGKPVAGQSVSVEAFQRTTHSYRRRLVGGFYAFDHNVETKRIGEICGGRTDEHGLLTCKAKTKLSGQLRLQATTRDAGGHRALASTDMWVAGEDEWWFEATPSDRMDVIPEQLSYESGQVARLQVRMPFRQATALVTVEREGVMESFVTELSGKEPVVEVPIGDAHSPNVYVSVLAIRGRVGVWRSRLASLVRWLHLPLRMEGGMPTSMVDLSKPAYRLGVAHINVGWDPHRLEVKVQPSAETFKVRDTAKVSISVKPAKGQKLPEDAEVAVAAVDEGLLELLPNDSWKLLEAMMQPRGLEVSTSTAQMQIVGKRHFGRKAGAPGGGGGRAPARELFDTLLLWKGRVTLDASGQAQLDIPLNDSLTSFRIVAVASAGDHLFGTGAATIRTTQELQLVSGLPSLVREGDRFDATVMLRNASVRAITAEVAGSYKTRASAAPTSLSAQSVKLDAGAAQEIKWAIEVPVDAATLDWEITAREDKGEAADRMKISQPVIAAYPVRTYQATLTQIDGSFSLPVERPKGAIAGRGGVHVDLDAQLGNLDGVIEFMSRYPYICLEQQLSQAIALHDAAQWQHVMNILPSYLDRDGLVKYFPSSWLQGSDALTAYVLAIAHEAGREIPDSSRARMLSALEGFVAGRIVRESAMPTMDLTVRKLAAIDALSRYGKAGPDMLSSVTVEPNLWPTSAVLDWIDILHRLTTLPDRAQRLPEALQVLRARLNFQGTTMTFSTERDDALWWLMISADSNAVRAISEVMDEPQWREDVPRMVRGALGRQLRGHWNTTVANAWGVLAFDKFRKVFESTPVTGTTQARLGGKTESAKWPGKSQALDLPWPEQPDALAIQHSGTGKPWAMIASRAALPLDAPLFTGYTVKRTVSAVEQKKKGTWSRGDVARVQLDLEAQSDMTWVVVDDPIPAGASIQGSGLGGSSQLLTKGEKREGDAWLAYEERRFDALRSYFVFVPKGKWSVEYTVRFNATGTFELPATRVEAMYAPEMFGELPNAPLQIQAP